MYCKSVVLDYCSVDIAVQWPVAELVHSTRGLLLFLVLVNIKDDKHFSNILRTLCSRVRDSFCAFISASGW